MDIFVTGASGYVGQAVVAELIGAGHRVTGLARSDAGAGRLEALGATVVRGDLDDPERLAAYAAESDGVAHLAFKHDDMASAGPADLTAIETIGGALAGSGKPLVTTSGAALVAQPGRTASEDDAVDLSSPLGAARGPSENATLALADRGVRSSLVRLAPTVHSDADYGFMTTLVAAAREHGYAAYVGDGENRWAAVHRSDAARLYRLALESAPAGTRLHGVAEEGVVFRELAEAIGRRYDVPVRSVSAEQAVELFGFVGHVAALDTATSSARTQELLGWAPTGPTLLQDLDAGAYDGATAETRVF